tara:strand:+ start:413 stop:658 length:246 start_codon:yes stop_codon:yes gene_type:complete
MIPPWALPPQLLEKLPDAKEGDVVACTVCHQSHILQAATHAVTGQKTDTLFYECCGDACVAAVKGKLIVDITPNMGRGEKQ